MNYTPKEFFVEKFYPIFYGGKRNLMQVNNSPFLNPANKKKTAEEKLNLFFNKIEIGDFDGCMFVGGYAKEKHAPTSFNVSTTYNHNIDENEIYYSWFGNALSVNLGGIQFLFDNEEILYLIYSGWQRYYNLLNQELYIEYKDKQINGWNNQWLNNACESYRKKPADKFNPLAEHKDSLKSISWVRLLFNLSRTYPNTNINAYAYKLSQTNETYGFFLFEMKKINTFLEFCDEYLGKNMYLSQPELFEQIYGTAYSVQAICNNLSIIGFNEIKPELIKLEEYPNKINAVKTNKYYKQIQDSEITYKLYNIYLMAKLNMKDIQPRVIEIATTLHKIKTNSRKNSEYQINNFLSARSRTKFLESFNELIDICLSNKLTEEASVLNGILELVIENETKLGDLMILININYKKIKLELN